MDELLNAVPIPLLRLEGQDRIARSNNAARALFGDQIDGRLVTDIIRHPDFHEALGLAFTGRAVQRFPLTVPTKSGSRHFDMQISPMARPGEALVAFQDLTEQEQTAAIRRDFVANVSHELRTPLTALVGFIETLRNAARDDPQARERFLTIMERETGRMIRLVNDLLSLSRVEAEEHRRPMARVSLMAILKTVLLSQRDASVASAISLTLDAPEEEFMVLGDADQLTQVFLNLTENALKYGGAGGAVTLRVSRIAREPKLRGPAVMVTVEDRGEGIDPLHLPRLTERFYRIDSHRSREKGGTGLGLAIVKHIVNRHRGRMRIESEPGKGSKFSVMLPSA